MSHAAYITLGALLLMLASLAIADLNDRLAAAEERAAAVVIPYRNTWLCKPIERRPGAFVCVEPQGKS